jgi:uncharacterized circularly permuted ATP-grasp superfamily protein/uncharacterized alpha-E superfamily protein
VTTTAEVSEALQGLGVEELRRRQDEATRLLDQEGVVYRDYGQPREERRRWRLDPMPVVLGSREWTEIEGGLIERAELLDLVLADLYGPRELLRRRLIPPEVVFGHSGFLHACDGIRLPGEHQLFNYAADLGRDESGRLVVLADRTQAPSGTGYAMENRLVCQRVLPTLYRDAGVHRLAPFFRWLRSALQAAAPPDVEDPRIVVLSPGPYNETAFEHAVLASTLGYPLVEGSDLTVRGGSVWMRSLGQREPVHVILRRVDDTYCDPLELNPESQLGVTGLVQATRAGTVTVVNALGSGVLENPALAAFEEAVARHLLGRPLRLPAVRTWWCGDPASRAYVLEHLPELVLRPTSPIEGNGSVFGWEESGAGLEDLRRRIEARPAAWVGQDSATTESAPTLTGSGIELRRSVLRAFAIPRGSSYVVMPGGLTRVAADTGRGRISAQTGAVSKDTWVLASEPERPGSFWLQSGPATPGLGPGALIPARVAENLWWLGRYAERAEAVTRLLRVVHDRRNEFQAATSEPGVAALHVLLAATTRVTATQPGFTGDDAGARLESPTEELLSLVVDARRPGTLAHATRGLVAAADAVRDQLSRDTWLVVGALDRAIAGLAEPGRDVNAGVQGELADVMQSLLALSGLCEESMEHDLGWRHMDAGRRLERSLQVLALLRATVGQARDTATDSLLLESVLTAAESIITYRRRYRSQAQLQTLLDLLLVDQDNPRSVCHSVTRLAEDLEAMPPGADGRLREDQRHLLRVTTALRLSETAALSAEDARGTRPGLEAFLAELVEGLLQTAEAVERVHVIHRLPQRRLPTT